MEISARTNTAGHRHHPHPTDSGVTAHGDPEVRRADPGAVISVHGLVCRYGDFIAVNGIDLTVQRGELFALLGTNGAGKTTTLETLEGHRSADAGRVRVLGRDPHVHRRDLAARIGVMFQHSGLPGNLTPHEMLTLWTQLTPDATRHRDVEATLAMVGLDHRSHVHIQRLSGGERRRLELAVALVNDPELVFLDEPTTGMDPEARQRTWQVLRTLLADGTTVVLTTHYLEEAESLADRLAIMHEGRLATHGTLADIIASYPARIHARLPQHAPALPSIGDTVHVDTAGRLRITTRRLQHDLTRLLRWADEHAVMLGELQAIEASLAQVFHRIAGTGHADHHNDKETPR